MGFAHIFFGLLARASMTVLQVVQHHLPHIFKRFDRNVACCFSSSAASDTCHAQHVHDIFKPTESGRCCRSLGSGCLGFLAMYRVRCCNSSFPLGSFGSRSSPPVVLAFLGPAGFERRPPALLARPTALCCTALALYSSTSCHKVTFHNHNFKKFVLETPPKSAAFRVQTGLTFRLEPIE